MNAAAATMHYRPPEDDNPFAGMTSPLVGSVLLHLSVLLLGIVTLPYLTPPAIVMPSSVTVEMVDITEIAQTDFVAPPNKPEEVSEEMPEKTPDPVYNNEETPPVLETPKEPEIAEEVPAPPVEKPEPQEQIPLPEDVTPAPIPKTKPKPPKPKPVVEKTQEKPKEKPAEKPKRDLSSLLKDISPDEKKDRTLDQILAESTSKSSKPSQIAQLGTAITASEIDAIKRGIQPCWNIDPGAEGIQNMKVTVRVHVGPDFVVQRVEILDGGLYGNDPKFNSFASSARNALLNPQCSRLNIPPDKYEQFKVFRATFDPRGMI